MNLHPPSSKTKPHHPSYLLDAHYCFAIECLVAALLFFSLQHRSPLSFQIVASWDGFALTGIILTWITILTQDPYDIRRRTRLKESTRILLFGVVLFASLASLLATSILLTSNKTGSSSPLTGTVILSIGTVILSWFFVQTRFILNYSSVYYHGAAKVPQDEVRGGLIFPGKEHPDYLDFAYFSFVVGMTCQVSDVLVSNRVMRRLVLMHGLIAFAFNTAIVALMVNIIAGLL